MPYLNLAPLDLRGQTPEDQIIGLQDRMNELVLALQREENPNVATDIVTTRHIIDKSVVNDVEDHDEVLQTFSADASTAWHTIANVALLPRTDKYAIVVGVFNIRPSVILTQPIIWRITRTPILVGNPTSVLSQGDEPFVAGVTNQRFSVIGLDGQISADVEHTYTLQIRPGPADTTQDINVDATTLVAMEIKK